MEEGIAPSGEGTWELWWVVAWHDGDLAPEYLAGPWYDKEHATYQAQKCIGRIDSRAATIGLVSSIITRAVINAAWKQPPYDDEAWGMEAT